MFRHSITFAALWSMAAAASMLALLADTRTAYATGMAVAAAFLALSAWCQSAILMAFVRRSLTRFEHVVKVIDAPPPMPSQRVVAFSANGIAREPIRVDPLPAPVNHDLLAFVQMSIDANGERGTRFLSVALYKVANVPHVRYQQYMGLLGSAVTTQPYGRCVGCSLGDIKARVMNGEYR